MKKCYIFLLLICLLLFLLVMYNIIINKEQFEDGNEKSPYSQLNQDINVLKFLNYKKNGFFIELGAVDGVNLSNTLLLENKYNWTGMLIEPDKNEYNKLITNRKNCICLNELVDEVSNLKKEFIYNESEQMLSGIVDTIDKERIKNHNTKTVTLITITLTDLLNKYNAPNIIDFLSLDTEGSELDILKGIDFNKYKFRYMSIEHNWKEPARGNIRTFLTKKGYKFYKENQWDDDFILDI